MKGRWLVIALALVACVAFAMSVQGGRWWVINDTEIGPFGSKRCFDDGCVPGGLSWLGNGERWMRIGMGAWAGSLISAFVLVVMSAALAAKRIPKLAAKTALVAMATAVITGGMFAMQYPSDVYPAEYGRGALLFVVALVSGVAAAVLVLRGKKI